MSATAAAELISMRATGRRFSASRTVRLGDVDGGGRLRYDAIARYLQDVASDDALDAGLPNAMGWVVRRTMIRVDDSCSLNEQLDLTTFCTGVGRSWAERRTTIRSAAGAATIEAVSLWVQIDVASGRPARLGEEFHAIYGEAAAGRAVSSKLSLPGPTESARRTRWAFRQTDLDPFEHVNNAAQWAVLEAIIGTGERRGCAELEYLAPIGLDAVDLADDGPLAWLVDDGRVLSAFRWNPVDSGTLTD